MLLRAAHRSGYGYSAALPTTAAPVPGGLDEIPGLAGPARVAGAAQRQAVTDDVDVGGFQPAGADPLPDRAPVGTQFQVVDRELGLSLNLDGAVRDGHRRVATRI